MKTDIKKFIPCQCHAGGALLTGIDFCGVDESDSQTISIYIVHTAGVDENPPSIWQRIKDAWQVICGREFYTCDVILNKEGTKKLRDACQESLDRWPEYEWIENPLGSTLHQLYVEMEDERIGRQLRLGKKFKE